MELNHDWIGFQSLFQPKARGSGTSGAAGTGPIHAIVEGDTILAAFAEQEDLAEWIGGSFRELAAQSRHRQILAFEREHADKLLQDSLIAGPGQGPLVPVGHAHFYDQVEMLRAQAKPASIGDKKSQDRLLEPMRHFLLEALHGWWAKMLPASYGIYLKVEGKTERHFLLVFRRGTFEGFHEPDLASMGMERRRQPLEVIKYLSERYIVPVQGIFVPAAEWEEWSQMKDPWGLVARSVRAERTRLVPRKMGLRALLAARSWFGL